MLDHYSGATRVIFILGDPIAQVKAPFGLTGEFARRTRLTPSAFVGDVVTVPEMTSMLLAARQRGCRMQTGIGMFQGNLGLMADFFAGAAGCDNAAR